MKISVLTPSIRKESLPLVRDSLALQTFRDFEWIVCSPFEYEHCNLWLKDRPQNPGDFWALYKALNLLMVAARGELVVCCNDSQYLKPDVLQKFWEHYTLNPTYCVAGIGDHFKKVVEGVGVDLTYRDVKWTQYKESFSETTLVNFDNCLASVPRKAIVETGLVDEEFDKGCCFGEREYFYRMRKLGYRLFIDLSINYVAQKHDKAYDPENKWEEMYKKNWAYYNTLVDRFAV